VQISFANPRVSVCARQRPVLATWFSGFIRGWRGDRRHAGYPARKFRDDEIVL
jgi:hypothetical protein